MPTVSQNESRFDLTILVFITMAQQRLDTEKHAFCGFHTQAYTIITM